MQTDRILLRPWQDSDAEALYKYASDPVVGEREGLRDRLCDPLKRWVAETCPFDLL